MINILLRSVVPALLLVAGPVAATSQLPDDAIVIAIGESRDPANVSAHIARQALAEIAVGEVERAWLALQSASDAVAFEQAAAAVIDALMLQPASAAGEQLLQRLQQTRVRVFRRHEETAADWFLPVYDIPGKAESARRVLALAERRDALLRAFEVDAVKAVRAHQDDSPGVLADALRLAPAATIERLAQPAVKGALELSSPAWAALARRLPQRDVLATTLVHAAPIDVLPLFDLVATQVEAGVALDWLQQAAGDPEYASIAVMSLGALAPRSPAAEQALVKHLGRTDTGASAAAALAQLKVPDRVERIVAISSKSVSAEQLRDVALALRLEGSPAAREALLTLARDPRLPEHVARELQR